MDRRSELIFEREASQNVEFTIYTPTTDPVATRWQCLLLATRTAGSLTVPGQDVVTLAAKFAAFVLGNPGASSDE